MKREHIQEEIRKLNERITVLEAEKAQEKYIRPLYSERSYLISQLHHCDT
jgi:hypothetical protein